MIDPFSGRSAPLAGPARDILPVTPDDAQDLPEIALAVYVETGGDVTLTSHAGHMRTVGVASWTILPVAARRIHATGTTAGGIHALVQA